MPFVPMISPEPQLLALQESFMDSVPVFNANQYSSVVSSPFGFRILLCAYVSFNSVAGGISQCPHIRSAIRHVLHVIEVSSPPVHSPLAVHISYTQRMYSLDCSYTGSVYVASHMAIVFVASLHNLLPSSSVSWMLIPLTLHFAGS